MVDYCDDCVLKKIYERVEETLKAGLELLQIVEKDKEKYRPMIHYGVCFLDLSNPIYADASKSIQFSVVGRYLTGMCCVSICIQGIEFVIQTQIDGTSFREIFVYDYLREPAQRVYVRHCRNASPNCKTCARNLYFPLFCTSAGEISQLHIIKNILPQPIYEELEEAGLCCNSMSIIG